ncbi:D-2-hydroxyacid dehydrogenase [Rhizobium sp. CNPSo 3968]|uniref:D-2-hydroxyacid dehydrogenase n=1 Tax=Rhizobium sp. CNPSo 3968 TaxID=3021408 RepID=UPI00254C78CE|nr:D-2-hydroxyacid dehydrogenase [Rhizobium sp. CNPSo 3968]MDK4717882.1 D-2-hydroxyacid dehydrogenase [Rhizobium sp. CNPSo 3968]
MNIVFLDRQTIGPSVDLTRPSFSHQWSEYAQTTPTEVEERISQADIVITNKVALTRELLQSAPKLKMVAVAATGYDKIDILAAADHGVIVSNVRNYARNTVPEHTFALIFAIRRSLIPYHRDVAAGEWQRSGQFCFFNHPIRDLAGSTLGVIGKGAIGNAVGKIADGIGMDVKFYDVADPAHSNIALFEEILETSDVITLHVPLTDGTRDLFTLREFYKMKRKPIIINTARGGIINEGDLVVALKSGLIQGFGVDTLTVEPPPPDHPILTVLDHPGVVVTPHVAWASHEAMQALWHQVVELIENFHQGKPTNVVT